MSGAPRLRSMNVSDADNLPVLGPAGNKVRSVSAARKPSPKPFRRVERTELGPEDERKKKIPPVDSPHISISMRLRRQELLLHSNLSLNASCSLDASIDSFYSRASTSRIGWPSISRRRQCYEVRNDHCKAGENGLA